jgi:FkbM family methyltransferase
MPTTKKELVLKVLSKEFDSLRYAIGKNEETLKAHKLAPLAGIIDDRSRENDEWNAIPLIKADSIPPKAAVLNCVSSISPISAAKRVKEAADNAVLISFSEICETVNDQNLLPAFVKEMKADKEKNGAEWKKLRRILADEESVQTLEDIIKFRISGPFAHMGNYNVRLKEQYFDPKMPLIRGDSFVDCGGFDGDTTEEFILRCPEYKNVWLFEPDDSNMVKAKNRLQGFRDIQFIQKGVSDKAGSLSFRSGSGSASSVADSGVSVIKVTTLDKEIQESVSIIKMDLEGWEMKAIDGATRHIIKNHPKMAIAVYHRASDFWMIPKMVLERNQKYKNYLRHYTEGWSKSVMYFLPA